MRPKLILTFLLIVFLPLAALSWLGIRVARDEQEVVQNKFRALLLGKLKDIDAVVARYLENRERAFLRLTELSSYDTAALRELVRKNPNVREVFVLDAQGKRIHPPPDGPLTASEKEFLERAGQVWRDKQIFYRPSQESSNRSDSSPRARPIDSAHGWYTWYWGNGINLVFWRRDPAGAVIAVECDRVRLLADIVGELPHSDPVEPNLPQGRIALLDPGGTTVYQWGAYEPAESESARTSIELSPPLNAWKLTYHTPDAEFNNAFGSSILFNFIASITVVWTALIALAAYFYRESTREMREASQRVSFVNQVSHELKTPLTNIRMYAELLEGNLNSEDEKTTRYLGVIVGESQRLSRLIGNVLTFARQQKNKLTLHQTAGCVDDVIRAVLDHFRPSLESKGMKIGCRAGADGSVEFDRDALEQILGNLFSNVEKYAASGGWMEVTSQQSGGRTQIVVADRGPGIPREHQARIFQPFHRVSDRVSDGVTGTGIGLTIARDLARRHGGDVRLVRSETGACFQVDLKTPAATPRTHP